MKDGEDLADNLDLFLDNTKKREIPKHAQADHLVPLLNSKATLAIAGMPPERKHDIDLLCATLRGTVLEVTRYASQAYWLMPKDPGDTFRAIMTKLLRMEKICPWRDTREDIGAGCHRKIPPVVS